MGLVQKIKLSDFKIDDLCRIDSKFHILHKNHGWNIFKSKNNNLVSLKEILTPNYENFDYNENQEYMGIPTGSDYLNEFGDIISYKIITKDEHPNRLKYKADESCILISSLKGAKIPALSFEYDISNHVFSNGFYIFKVSEKWNKRFILYILRTNTIKSILDNNIYRGIGISAYREKDLLKIQIPLININVQNQLIDDIKSIEQEIENLKNQKRATQDILNDILSNKYKVNLSELKELESIKQFNIKFNGMSKKNYLIRNSFKWQKLEKLQNYMYKNINCIKKLSNYIISTNNGWSPKSSEMEEGIPVLGQEHILKSGKISLEPSKFTTLTRNNIDSFFIKKDDFFVSRGNTIDLVALAGIVEKNTNKDIIYPDLYIKVDFIIEYVNKEYMTYIFNSFFGRIYFKHVAKGKNQTMVKVSAKEILDFEVPLPSIKEQEDIVNDIKFKINAQNKINKQIKQKQNEISKIIEDVMRGNFNETNPRI